jgi:hypothetical protein
MEVATLKWLADLLKQLAGGVLGEKLKPKTSSERAWEVGRRLWVDLKELEDSSGKFVEELRIASEEVAVYNAATREYNELKFAELKALMSKEVAELKPLMSKEVAELMALMSKEADAAGRKDNDSLVHPDMGPLRIRAFHMTYTIDALFKSVNTVGRSLSAINPQLSIHAPRMEDLIEQGMMQRRTAMDEANKVISDLWGGSPSSRQLAAVLAQAEDALSSITQSAELLRDFLASQFSFKESF